MELVASMENWRVCNTGDNKGICEELECINLGV